MAESDRDLWNSREWLERRLKYREYEEWFDGTRLDVGMEKRDRVSGKKIKRFPLRLNLTGLACEIHRDLTRGTPARDDTLAVRTVVGRSDDRELAEQLETIINDGVWRPSHGGPVQQEALLAMNIFGGTVLKLAWEPWEQDLPYRLAVRLVKNPGHIHPTCDWLNPWKLLECYVGYEITPKEALLKYGITVKDENRPVLYMEYWSEQEWRIRVDDQVPVMQWGSQKWKLQGPNPWGFVPIYYIPHERTKDSLFGDSVIPRQKELVEEINSRTADIADTVRAMRPGMYVGHDLGGSLNVRRVMVDGATVARVIDIGAKRVAPNAGAPGLDPLPVPEAPEALLSFPQELRNFWMMVARISPAVFGLDDTRSGRITGPAISQRMWTSVAHSTTERINFAEAKNDIDRGILYALARKAGPLAELGVSLPTLSEKALAALDISQKWPPMIPLERQDRHKELTDRLREAGISIEDYLTEQGVEDIEGEKELILEWQRALLDIETESKVTIQETAAAVQEKRQKEQANVDGNARPST